jgi:hypothetical protein
MRFFNTPKSSTPRSAAAGGNKHQHPEEAVQSDIGLYRHLLDRIGVRCLGEAKWYYVKGLHFAFWGAASCWYLLFFPQDSRAVVAGVSAFTAAMIVLAINAGAEMQEAFLREEDKADLLTKRCQELEVELDWARLENIQARPVWGSGDAAEASGDFEASADVLFINPKNGRRPQF